MDRNKLTAEDLQAIEAVEIGRKIGEAIKRGELTTTIIVIPPEYLDNELLLEFLRAGMCIALVWRRADHIALATRRPDRIAEGLDITITSAWPSWLRSLLGFNHQARYFIPNYSVDLTLP